MVLEQSRGACRTSPNPGPNRFIRDHWLANLHADKAITFSALSFSTIMTITITSIYLVFASANAVSYIIFLQ